MTPERWREIDEIFQQAADQPVARRSSFVEERCAGDAELRREVESLLVADGDSERFVDAKFSDLDLFADLSSGAIPEGGRAGVYRILRLIGSGGMASVYLAERADGEFQQRVAIKFVRGGHNDPEWARNRFRMEREILARLEHPNIARLLDGGTAPNGTPYLVMEYVEGLPMQTWLTQRKPSVREILRVFLALCDAVAYAHRKLVVHRDIKPANILVEADGTPKLLDFGISKPLSGGDVQTTATIHRAMTPGYASPEQIRGEFVSTSSDVYSLGAVLYEALGGHAPFDLSGATPAEAERLICETGPAPLKGPADLVKIVQKAMHRSPERRYSSVENLAADIRRYQAGRPVEAQPDSFWYRSAKFVARNRKSVVAASGAVLTLAALAANLVNAAQQQRGAFSKMRIMANSVLLDVPEVSAGREASEIRLELARNYDRHALLVARELNQDLAVLREVALGYEKMALVLGIHHPKANGNVREALEYFEKAKSLVEPLRPTWFDQLLRPAAARGVKGLVGRSHCNIGRLREFEGKRALDDYERCLAILEKLTGTNPGAGVSFTREYIEARLLVGSATADLAVAKEHFEAAIRIAGVHQAAGALKNAPLLWRASGLWSLWRLDGDRAKLEEARKAIAEARSRNAAFDVDARVLELRVARGLGAAYEVRRIEETLRREFPRQPLVQRALAEK